MMQAAHMHCHPESRVSAEVLNEGSGGGNGAVPRRFFGRTTRQYPLRMTLPSLVA